jgi:uncharacterized NAD(P)/FAD-binding protein YdhS
LFERSGSFARGVAYATPSHWHRLNVQATKMGGANNDDPNGFVNWLAKTQAAEPQAIANAFVPRWLYGEYLRELLCRAERTASVRRHAAEVTAVKKCAQGYRLHLASGSTYDANAVVLAIGLLPPAPPLPKHCRLIDDIWADEKVAAVGPSDDVLILGTGATAIDAVLSLLFRGHRGTITLISRRGLLPQRDVDPSGYPDWFRMAPGRGVRDIMRALRREARAAEWAGAAWQSVVDAFRVHASAIWQAWPERERSRFLRHARAFWMVHRHRLAPDIAERIDLEIANGRLRLLAGRVINLSERASRLAITARARGGQGLIDIAADWVLNCTGPSERVGGSAHPVLRQLLKDGLAQPGPLGIGLDVDGDLRLVGRTDLPQTGLYAVGALTRGCFWEVTAVPHIREQAGRASRHLLAEAAAHRLGGALTGP